MSQPILGFPAASTQLVDPQTGIARTPWVMLLQALWSRSSALEASSPDNSFASPTILNGWVAAGGNYAAPSYLRDGLGFVHLRGSATGQSSGAPVLVLPVGFRPAYNGVYPAVVNGAAGVVSISTSGEVSVTNGATSFSLDGIVFQAA